MSAKFVTPPSTPRRPIQARRTVTFPQTPLRLTRTASPPNGRTPHLHLPTPTTPHKPPPPTTLPTKSILKRRAPSTPAARSSAAASTSHTIHSPLAHAFRRDTNRVRKSLSTKTLAAKQRASSIKAATGQKLNKIMVLLAAEAVGLGCVWQLGREGLVRSMPSGVEEFASLAGGVAGQTDMSALVGLGLAWTGCVAVGGMLSWAEGEKMEE